MKTIKLLIILTILMVGCDREQPSLIDTHYTVEINICDYPYCAVPGDTISDADAFQLAVDVASSLKGRSVFDTINVIIVIPLGEYIIDRTINFDNHSLEIEKNYSIIGIHGSNINISNVHITDY